MAMLHKVTDMDASYVSASLSAYAAIERETRRSVETCGGVSRYGVSDLQNIALDNTCEGRAFNS
jgi:hypothetical protein